MRRIRDLSILSVNCGRSLSRSARWDVEAETVVFSAGAALGDVYVSWMSIMAFQRVSSFFLGSAPCAIGSNRLIKS